MSNLACRRRSTGHQRAAPPCGAPPQRRHRSLGLPAAGPPAETRARPRRCEWSRPLPPRRAAHARQALAGPERNPEAIDRPHRPSGAQDPNPAWSRQDRQASEPMPPAPHRRHDAPYRPIALPKVSNSAAGRAQQDAKSLISLTKRLEWCPGAESNHRHRDFQSRALPTELPGHVADPCRPRIGRPGL